MHGVLPSGEIIDNWYCDRKVAAGGWIRIMQRNGRKSYELGLRVAPLCASSKIFR